MKRPRVVYLLVAWFVRSLRVVKYIFTHVMYTK